MFSILDTSRVTIGDKAGIPDSSKTIAKAITAPKETLVITSAQNATPPFRAGWRTLLNYCRVNNATLVVIPFRYKNPTSMWSQQARTDDVWDSEILPYIMAERVMVNGNLMILGDIMTQPTATRPLEGFETITGPQSGIIGHPKLEVMTIPTPQSKLPKILMTTGAITERNYLTGKAGKKGEFHHTYGAAVVEVDGDRFYVRQINMKNDGSFCDLMAEYSGDEVRPYVRIPALVMGDTHVNVIDPGVVEATFTGARSMIKLLKPEALVWHDVHDGTAKNHHERGRVFHEFVKFRSGQNDVRRELQRTFQFMDTYTPPDTASIVVPSNHNDFLREWVENTDPREDPENCVFWAETFKAICDSPATSWTPEGPAIQDAFAYWGQQMLRSRNRTTFLVRGQSYQIKGIEVGYHGDKGPNGAKGSRSAFGKIGAKSIIGHAHSPGITDGCYQVGTSSLLGLTYASGSPSSWLHTHCAIYPNGKRSLLNIIEGRWRA